MRTPSMSPLRVTLLALAVLASFGASSASAQLTLIIQSISGTTSTWERGEAISAADCDAESMVTLEVTGITTDVMVLDFWRGTTCNAVTSRDMGTAEADC